MSKMTDMERETQVMKASNGLQKKLEDPKYRKEHFEKVFKNSRIGYISKGQQEVYEFVKDYGFLIEQPIGSLLVDIVSFDLKKIIEYNGDFFHCNPRQWKEDDYNKTIKMTAKQKWENDRNRRFFLRKNGYDILVVWESAWKDNKENTKKKIIEYIKEKNEVHK